MKSRKSSDRRQLELDLPLNQPDSSPPSKPKLSKPLRSPRQGLDEELTRQSRELVIAVGLEDLAKQITVSWNSRLRTTAGRAYRNEQLVELWWRIIARGGSGLSLMAGNGAKPVRTWGFPTRNGVTIYRLSGPNRNGATATRAPIVITRSSGFAKFDAQQPATIAVEPTTEEGLMRALNSRSSKSGPTAKAENSRNRGIESAEGY